MIPILFMNKILIAKWNIWFGWRNMLGYNIKTFKLGITDIIIMENHSIHFHRNKRGFMQNWGRSCTSLNSTMILLNNKIRLCERH